MAEARPTSERALESRLRDVGGHLAYPPTPNLAVAIRGRLAERSARGEDHWYNLWRARMRPAFVALAFLAVIGAVLLLDPTMRVGIAQRLGLRTVAIEYVPSVGVPPTRAPAAMPSGAPSDPRLSLGDRVSLAQAAGRVSSPIVVPTVSELGAPDEVYVSDAPPGGQVALVYGSRPGLPSTPETGVGLLFTEFDGSLVRGQFGKGLGPGTRLEEVQVAGEDGLWIEGNPHAVFGYQDAVGQMRGEAIRLAANTLVWQRGSLVLRLEGALSKEKALRIAASVR